MWLAPRGFEMILVDVSDVALARGRGGAEVSVPLIIVPAARTGDPLPAGVASE